ncbi:hypothetical protein [Synechococcus sp. PCC 6312]|uniref:hypothetical protein n=1 Tax=Synechococcus sp. (strain ATCC 27167 / PCC 6312) TaxID=195253 RepID=UPI00029F21C0|nr:hypothetical protein [Synechococcus sp. PCC 6312]AFY61804.1 hypothetical protein Syn6312_2722 [Synechococcus sp. PCC 6312]
MIPAVMAALESGDLTQAMALLETLPPDQPQVMLGWAWLEEKKQNLEAAETRYRDILRQDCGPKIILRARQGLERIATTRKQQQMDALATVAQAPGGDQRAILVLEAVPNPEVKTKLAQQLTRIMDIEPYAARLLLPSRGWRLLRNGTMAELAVYGSQLRAAGIPAFWLPLDPLQELTVIEVRFLQSLSPQVQAGWGGHGSEPPQHIFTFNWEEVTQRVEGQLPIFETVVDRDSRGTATYKSQVQDHAQCCDLHLPSRQTILRFYRGHYQFNRGIDLTPVQGSEVAADQETSWANWRQLLAVFNHCRPGIPIWSDFTSFAETVLEHTDLLEKINPHLDLFRREDCYWDHAFQLYSGLIMALSGSEHRPLT